jgi:glutamyl endopeptidase
MPSSGIGPKNREMSMHESVEQPGVEQPTGFAGSSEQPSPGGGETAGWTESETFQESTWDPTSEAATLEEVSGVDSRTLEAEAGQVEPEYVLDAEYSLYPEVVAEQALALIKSGIFAETVLGDDNRVRITKTNEAPWKHCCSLLITMKDGKRFIGSGAFVSRRVIVTAGHCVSAKARGGFAKHIKIIPGRNGNYSPFGSREVTNTADTGVFSAPTQWIQEEKREFDWGLIILGTNNKFDANVGHFGVVKTTGSDMTGWLVNNAGYPGDREGGQNLYFNANKIVSATDKQVAYLFDSYGGQSGSPVWGYWQNGGRKIVAIHHAGAAKVNYGARVNDEVYSVISDYIQKFP